MRFLRLAVAALTFLLGGNALANVAGDDKNWAVVYAELPFAAASSCIGLINVDAGLAGDHSRSASLLGLCVGVTSLLLSRAKDAEVPELDVATGIVAVGWECLAAHPRQVEFVASGVREYSRRRRQTKLLNSYRACGKSGCAYVFEAV